MNEHTTQPTLPPWLTVSLIQDAVRKGLKKNVEFLESKLEMASSAGDNYGSQMLRYNFLIKTSTNPEKFSVVVKIKAVGQLADEFEPIAIFERETDAYKKTLPAIEEYLKKIYPDMEKLWPDCYYHQESPNDLLVLEDLKPGGFIMGKRIDGLDLEHATLVVESLAKLHAASIPVCKNQPDIPKNYDISFWNRQNKDLLKKILLKPFLVFSKNFQTWPEFDKKKFYADKLKNLEEVILEKTFQTWDKEENRLNVLLHGDLWTNNFMFRYDAGKVTGIKFVDFQVMNFNSPVMDLQYFIFSSVCSDVKFDAFDLLLEKYHASFTETLKRMDFKLDISFTLEDLKVEFRKKVHWGFMILCSLYPFVDSTDIFDPDSYFTEDDDIQFERVYKKENVRKNILKGFEYFEKFGIF